MHPVNILRIFAFSLDLVLGHSNSNNTLRYFNSFGVFWGHPVYIYIYDPVKQFKVKI